MMNTRSPKPEDRHVGQRIRMRRVELNVTQETLGEAIGVSFQQVQKYERGDNRVGISRLQAIAQQLQCNVDFFLLPAPTAQPGKIDSVMDSFMATKDGVTMARAFVRITDANVRRSIANFVDSLSRNRADAPSMQPAE